MENSCTIINFLEYLNRFRKRTENINVPWGQDKVCERLVECWARSSWGRGLQSLDRWSICTNALREMEDQPGSVLACSQSMSSADQPYQTQSPANCAISNTRLLINWLIPMLHNGQQNKNKMPESWVKNKVNQMRNHLSIG